MRSTLLASSAICISSALALAFGGGCSAVSEDSASNSEAVTSAELSQARAAVALIAGAQAHCNECHTASRDDVQRWGTAMQAVEHDCLAPELTLTREQRVACLGNDPASATPSFAAERLGLYAAGARLDQFKNLILGDAPTAADTANWTRFQARAAMPLGSDVAPMTDAQFQTVKKWVLAGMPALDLALTDPDLGPCETDLTPALGEHIATMKTQGWAARHLEAATPMYGCSGSASGAACLGDLPDITSTWGATDQQQTLRKLREMSFTSSTGSALHSHWWIRSSPDGQYTGFGLNVGAKMIDLTKPGIIDVKASYDPQFFPDNSGFSYAGVGSNNGPIKVCKKSVLDAASPAASITLNEPGCNTIIASVYQTVGASLDNSLYLMSTGTHVNDDAESTGQGPRSGFDTNAGTLLTPMVSDGSKFIPKPNITLALPFEGDQALSASNKLLLTRFGGKTGKRGYKIRKLNVTTTPTTTGATYAATSDVIGTVCLNGAKPAMSYNERFIVSHQYVDPAENTGLPPKSSNIVLVDLLTGEVARLTTMGDRQYAFAPHFRADGWIYWVVRDMNSPTETLVASDAALRRMAATP